MGEELKSVEIRAESFVLGVAAAGLAALGAVCSPLPLSAFPFAAAGIIMAIPSDATYIP